MILLFQILTTPDIAPCVDAVLLLAVANGCLHAILSFSVVNA